LLFSFLLKADAAHRSASGGEHSGVAGAMAMATVPLMCQPKRFLYKLKDIQLN
jgi:hypothetical protein